MSNETWWYDEECDLVVDLTIPEGRSAALAVPVCRVLTSGVARSVTEELGRRIARVPQMEAEIERLRGELRWQIDNYDPTAPEIAYRRAKSALMTTEPTTPQERLMEYHLSEESMNTLCEKGLREFMGDGEWCEDEQVLLVLAASLGLIPKGVSSWKSVVYCTGSFGKFLYGLLSQLVAVGLFDTKQVNKHETLFRLPSLDELWILFPPLNAMAEPSKAFYREGDMRRMVEDGGLGVIFDIGPTHGNVREFWSGVPLAHLGK